MFNRMLSSFGIGGPSVDTVLDSAQAVPGQLITGQVHVRGGHAETEIGQVVLSAVTRVEHTGFGVGAGDADAAELVRVVLRQGLRVPAGERVSIPFQLPLPWETPITAVDGVALPGMSVGVRTELVVAGAPGQGDRASVLIGPLPSQNAVLDAIGQLGFSFRAASVASGRLPGVSQESGLRQELAFFPPAQFAGRVNQVVLTFLADQQELRVILAADGRPGGFAPTGDPSGQLRLSHQEAQTTDWAAAISGWLAQVAQNRQPNPAFTSAPNPAFGGQPGHQAGYDAHPGPGDPRGQRGGSGRGGLLAAGAAGAAGGLLGGVVLGGMAEEFFDDDEG